jgi:Ala-tRNA(Pro) deacylase
MKEVYNELEKFKISYEKVDHEAVFTVEQSQKIKEKMDGIGCKNLFLKDPKNNYYLIILNDHHQISLKDIAQKINSKRLSFASNEE